MKPFDLKKALDGEPVKLENGFKAYVHAKFDNPDVDIASMLGHYINKNGKEVVIYWYADGRCVGGDGKNIAGMWDEDKPQNLETVKDTVKPFNLEKALDGKPVKLRDGNKAYVLKAVNNDSYYLNLIGYIEVSCGIIPALWLYDTYSHFNEIEGYYSKRQNIIGMWED